MFPNNDVSKWWLMNHLVYNNVGGLNDKKTTLLPMRGDFTQNPRGRPGTLV